VAAHAPVFELEGEVRTLLAVNEPLSTCCSLVVCDADAKNGRGPVRNTLSSVGYRKTTPLWRALEKHGCGHGGGYIIASI